MAASVPVEKEFFHNWTLRKTLELQQKHPGNDAEVMAAIQDLFASMEGPEQHETNRWQQVFQAVRHVRHHLPFIAEKRAAMRG